MAWPEGSSGVGDGKPALRRMGASPGGGPTVPRRLLGAQLRRLREERKITLEDAGDVIRASGSKMSRLENGRVSFKDRDISDLLTFYGVTDEQQRAALRELARSAGAHGWWHDYSDVLPSWFEAYVGLEEAATNIRAYENQFVPGLLQTEDYARAVIAAGAVDGSPEAVDRNVAFRMARQPALTSEDPPQLWAVLDEAALRRQVGGSGLMRLQLDHLLDVAGLPNVAIQVLPFGAGAHPAMGRPFVILAFPERADPDVVYLEDLTSALYVENVDEVDRYNVFFNHLRATALSFEESAALITSVMKDL
ncbi:MAG TPA: helix-turn-helix transcriptional regulator [Streptosporangiaceae bacterium]|nr:helix-turn-helix transcriptional regulator [Streptosporangiaceae bacterium]